MRLSGDAHRKDPAQGALPGETQEPEESRVLHARLAGARAVGFSLQPVADARTRIPGLPSVVQTRWARCPHTPPDRLIAYRPIRSLGYAFRKLARAEAEES
jgi:hypothetical protein